MPTTTPATRWSTRSSSSQSASACATAGYAIVLGVLGGGGIVVSNILSEAFERRLASGKRIYNGGGGFDFDDLLYLLGPAAWLGWLAPILVGASIGAPVMALISWLKLHKLSADRTT